MSSKEDRKVLLATYGTKWSTDITLVILSQSNSQSFGQYIYITNTIQNLIKTLKPILDMY